MKRTKIAYWIVTGFIGLILALGSVFNVVSSPESIELISHKLGYPEYLIPMLGVAKLLGVAVILIPGFPRLKEWAYAGLTYDLGGALYSHIRIGEPILGCLPFVFFLSLIGLSYFLYHKIQKNNPADSRN